MSDSVIRKLNKRGTGRAHFADALPDFLRIDIDLACSDFR